MKLLEDTIARNTNDVGFGKDSYTIVKAQSVKGNNGKVDSINIKYSAL